MDFTCHDPMPSSCELMSRVNNDYIYLLHTHGITGIRLFKDSPRPVYTGFVNAYSGNAIHRSPCFIKICDEKEHDVTTLLSRMQYEDARRISPERVVEVFPCVLPNPTRQMLVLKSYDGTLEDLLKIHTIGEYEFNRICDSILKGLKFIHGAAIIHCDLKLPNVFVDRTCGNYVIGDFGISCDVKAAKLGKLEFDHIPLWWKNHYHIPRKLFTSPRGTPFGYEVDMFSYVTLIIQMHNSLLIRKRITDIKMSHVQLDDDNPKLLIGIANPVLYATVKNLIVKIRSSVNNAAYRINYTKFDVSRILAYYRLIRIYKTNDKSAG